MATYNYRCKECNHQFEVNKTMNDSNRKEKCPKCKTKRTVKIIKPLSIIFKGSGFTKSVNNE